MPDRETQGTKWRSVQEALRKQLTMEMGKEEKDVEGGVSRRMEESGRCWDLESEDLNLNFDSPIF